MSSLAYYLPTDWEIKDFYRRNIDSLFRCCSFLTCGEGNPEEMAENIILRLLRKGMVFSSDQDGKAWMFLEAYRMSRKLPKSPDQKVDQAQSSLPAGEIARDTESQDDAAEAAACACETTAEPESGIPECSEADNSAPAEEPSGADMRPFPEQLRKLSRKDRLIALMYYCEGFRKSEIAAYLGWTSFMVDHRLNRIKKRILLEKGGEE